MMMAAGPDSHYIAAFWEYSPEGVDILDLDIRLYLTPGGRAAGKTFPWSYKATQRAARLGWQVLLLRNYETSADDGVLQTCRYAAARSGVRYDAPAKSKEIRFPGSGGRISVRGTELKPDVRLRDIEGKNLVICEESQFMGWLAWETLEPTTRTAGSKIVMIWNPTFEDDTPERLLREPPPRTWWPGRVLTIDDNPAPTRESRESEHSARGGPMHPHIWLGTYRPLQGAVFDAGKLYERRIDPADIVASCRAWDMASTEGGGDYSVGLLIYKLRDGSFHVADVVRGQWHPAHRRTQMDMCAQRDGEGVLLRWEEEGGSSGKDVSFDLSVHYAGFNAVGVRSTGNKTMRADASAVQVNIGNVSIEGGAPWAARFKAELSAFPTRGVHDDQVDAFSLGFNTVAQAVGGDWSAWYSDDDGA